MSALSWLVLQPWTTTPYVKNWTWFRVLAGTLLTRKKYVWSWRIYPLYPCWRGVSHSPPTSLRRIFHAPLISALTRRPTQLFSTADLLLALMDPKCRFVQQWMSWLIWNNLGLWLPSENGRIGPPGFHDFLEVLLIFVDDLWLIRCDEAVENALYRSGLSALKSSSTSGVEQRFSPWRKKPDARCTTPCRPCDFHALASPEYARCELKFPSALRNKKWTSSLRQGSHHC